MRLVLAFSVIALAGCAATPPPASSAAAPAASAAPVNAKMKYVEASVDPNKKICRRMMQTGSLQPQRICSTPAEWAEYDRRASEGVDRMNALRRSGGINGDFETPAPGSGQSTNAERALHN